LGFCDQELSCSFPFELAAAKWNSVVIQPLSFWKNVAKVLRLAAPPRWAGATIIALGMAAAAIEAFGLLLTIPLIQSLGANASRSSGLEHLFDRVLAPIPEGYFTGLLVVLLCVTILLKSGINLINNWVTRYVHGLVAHRLRAVLFDQTISSCLDYRVGQQRSDIVVTMSENTWKVSTALSLIYRLVICSCTFAIFVLVMIIISIKLMLIAMVFLTLSTLIVRAASRRASEIGRAVVEENKQFGLRMWESISALQLIRAFGREEYEASRFRTLSDRVRRRILKLDLLWAMPGPISEISITLLVGTLILIARTSGISIAATAAFLFLLYRLQGPTQEMTQSKVALETLGGAIDDIANFLYSTRKPYLVQGDLIAPPIQRAVRLSNVSFRYSPEEPWALRNISVEIPAGKTTAIIGRSGAGKSTIMALLFRFHDPTEGEVTADDISLPRFRLSSWRARLALMSQEVQLFNDTIETNIAYGDLNADVDSIRSAAIVAHAETFIQSMPQGYRTIVGDHGMRLSGGQRQRIALARTILRNPDILMLDEATNALDIESERAFQFALKEYSHQRTIVVIAHRLSTVERADQVIVMEGGRVVEAGSPNQLLDRKGHFARLHDLQLGVVAPSAAG
jgi:subfamily B ATP-binding cassette protein MsbA